MSTAAIEVQKLRKVYREGWLRRPFEALKEVSFTVGRGEIFGLLGPNGAGKTTFIKILLGIVRPSEGNARLLGLPAGAREGRRRVGYLPENLRIPRHHNALTALEFYGRLSGLGWADIRRRRMELLELVGLASRAQDSVRKYSKGMLQRLGLAQALLHDPEVLFLDEPTDGLDPVGRKHVRTVLTQLRDQGKTIFLNSHLLQEVELVCDRVAILDSGKLRKVGTPASLVPSAQTGVELDLLLLASEAAVRSALGFAELLAAAPQPGGLVQVLVRVDDQAAIDRCVDALRSSGISIVQLAPRRTSLEDAFLRVLGMDENAS